MMRIFKSKASERVTLVDDEEPETERVGISFEEVLFCNIPSYVKDPFCRYRMPVPTLRYESRKIGATEKKKQNVTKICNFMDIVKALRRQPFQLTNYFSAYFEVELFLEKKSCLIAKTVSPSEIKEAIDCFVEDCVLCVCCRSVETQMNISQNNVIIECNVCGKSHVFQPDNELKKKFFSNLMNLRGKANTETESENKPKRDKRRSDTFPRHSSFGEKDPFLFEYDDVVLEDPVEKSMKNAFVLTENDLDVLRENGSVVMKTPQGSQMTSPLSTSKYSREQIKETRDKLFASIPKSKLFSFAQHEDEEDSDDLPSIVIPTAQKASRSFLNIPSKFFDFSDFDDCE